MIPSKVQTMPNGDRLITRWIYEHHYKLDSIGRRIPGKTRTGRLLRVEQAIVKPGEYVLNFHERK